MNVSGEFTIKSPPKLVFDTLRDAHSFVQFVDDVQEFNEIDPIHYEAVFETKVAYLKFRINVTGEITLIGPPDVIEAKIKETPLGIIGRLTATTRTDLSEANDETKAVYLVESTNAGKLDSIGKPDLRTKAIEMEKIFAVRLREAFVEKVV